MKRLIAGRTDIFIEQEYIVDETLGELDKDKFAPSSVYQAGIMWMGSNYLFLHKKHASLLPKIAEVLKAMKQEALIERNKDIAKHLK